MHISRSLEKDIIKRLEIDPSTIFKKFESFGDVKKVIQYENPNYLFTISKLLKPKIECYGITNRCEDGKFILFLDYDKIFKETIYKNLNALIKAYPKHFDNFFIATTEPEITTGNKIKGSYHVINLVKHYKYQIKEYMKYCDIDQHYFNIPEKTPYKAQVLRISEKIWKANGKTIKEKPKFIEMYPKKLIRSKKEISYPHYKLFKKEWGMIDEYAYLRNFDKLKKLELCKYSTPKGSQKQ